jgi:hypothetical protein
LPSHWVALYLVTLLQFLQRDLYIGSGLITLNHTFLVAFPSMTKALGQDEKSFNVSSIPVVVVISLWHSPAKCFVCRNGSAGHEMTCTLYRSLPIVSHLVGTSAHQNGTI